MENSDNKSKNKNPFSVPEHYFDGLTEKVMARVDQEERPQKAGWLITCKPYLGLAAIFLIALFVVQVIVPHFIDSSRMLKKEGRVLAGYETADPGKEYELDAGFNPTSEEILEYLSTEVNNYDLIYAELY